jgi:mono/diheme cytochrome c family protein
MTRSSTLLALVLLTCTFGGGCRQDMHDQPNYTPLEPTNFFGDGLSSRQPVEGTVARGQLRLDDHLYTGRLPRAETARGPADYATTFPFAIDSAALDRGQQQYDVFCSPCHDRLGGGNGMIVRRGFRRAASLHDQRLIDAPVGYFYDVITNGFGAMSDYASQIPVEDRWKIIAYVRALQLSQNGSVDDLTAEQRTELRGGA